MIYSFKKTYGIYARYLVPSEPIRDLRTGVSSTSYTSYNILVVKVPASVSRNIFNQGNVDIKTITFLIDKNDIPIKPSTNHTIVVGNERFEILSITDAIDSYDILAKGIGEFNYVDEATSQLSIFESHSTTSEINLPMLLWPIAYSKLVTIGDNTLTKMGAIGISSDSGSTEQDNIIALAKSLNVPLTVLAATTIPSQGTDWDTYLRDTVPSDLQALNDLKSKIDIEGVLCNGVLFDYESHAWWNFDQTQKNYLNDVQSAYIEGIQNLFNDLSAFGTGLPPLCYDGGVTTYIEPRSLIQTSFVSNDFYRTDPDELETAYNSPIRDDYIQGLIQAIAQYDMDAGMWLSFGGGYDPGETWQTWSTIAKAESHATTLASWVYNKCRANNRIKILASYVPWNQTAEIVAAAYEAFITQWTTLGRTINHAV